MAQTLDTTFNPPTLTGTWGPSGLAVQSDGKLLVGLAGDLVMGSITDLGLHRLNVDGSIDETWVGQNNWDPEPEGEHTPLGFAVLRDDKVLVWCKANVQRPSPDPSRNATRIVRLLKDGAIDPDFPKIDLFWPGFGDGVLSIVVDHDENFIACGTIVDLAYDQGPLETWTDRAVARFLRDGTFDRTTHRPAITGGTYYAVPLIDGRYLLVGSGQAAGFSVDGVEVDEFARARAMVFHDFSHDSSFNDSSTFDGYGRKIYGGARLGSTQSLLVGDFQWYGFSGSYTTNMVLVSTADGSPVAWPGTAGDLRADTNSRMPGNLGASRFDSDNICVDRKSRVYVSGKGWLYRLPSSGAVDPDWDYEVDLTPSDTSDPFNWPKSCTLVLDPTHTKLYLAGNERVDRFGTTPTQRLMRMDVDTLDSGFLDASVVLTMQEEEEPDPDPDPDPEGETVTVSDGLALSGSISPLPIGVVREYAALAATLASLYDGTAQASDTAAIGDGLNFTLHVALSEGLILQDNIGVDMTRFVRVVARLLMSGAATGYADAVVQVLDTLVAAALADAMARGDLSDTAVMSDTVTALYHAFARLIEQAVLSDTATGTSTAFVLVSETVALSADLSHAAELVALLRDSVGFAATLAVDNGEYIAWTMNTEGDKPVSRYTNWPFNSMAKVGGRYVGCDAAGLHWLDEGNDDSGEAIRARLRAGLQAMGTRRLKRLPEAFIAYRSDGTLLLRLIQVNEETGEKEAGTFYLRPRPAGNTRENRFTPGRGWKAVEFDFELENVDGADFDLTALEFRPLYLDRRTRG